jgi:hypothetical protein
VPAACVAARKHSSHVVQTALTKPLGAGFANCGGLGSRPVAIDFSELSKSTRLLAGNRTGCARSRHAQQGAGCSGRTPGCPGNRAHSDVPHCRRFGRESDALRGGVDPPWHTDGCFGYAPLERKGYRHQITVLRGQANASELMPRVHRVIGTHQGAVSLEYRNIWTTISTASPFSSTVAGRAKFFFRLVQRAIPVDPSTYRSTVRSGRLFRR